MKRTGFKKKAYKPMKRTKLNVVGHSTTAQDKAEIQRLVRLIVTKRDKGCLSVQGLSWLETLARERIRGASEVDTSKRKSNAMAQGRARPPRTQDTKDGLEVGDSGIEARAEVILKLIE